MDVTLTLHADREGIPQDLLDIITAGHPQHGLSSAWRRVLRFTAALTPSRVPNDKLVPHWSELTGLLADQVGAALAGDVDAEPSAARLREAAGRLQDGAPHRHVATRSGLAQGTVRTLANWIEVVEERYGDAIEPYGVLVA